MWIGTAWLPYWPPSGQQVSHQRWIEDSVACMWWSMQVRDPLSLWNPGQTSPEVQNKGISGPTKKLMSSNLFWKNTANSGFPLGLENLENLGKWEGIFQSGKSQGILNRLEKSGKITKYWKTEINWYKYYLIFLVIFKWTVHYLLKWIKFSFKKKPKR